jgi:SapC
MPKQLLIYETVVPLSASRHRDSAVELDGTYDFSGKVNSVPLMAVEFPHAAAEYAIVFAGNDGNPMPAVILGVRGNENLYISKDKAWEAKYIPAFVRRYPFVFSTSPDGKQLILCIDEAFAGFNSEGRGQRLFDDGKPTPYVDNVLKFLQEFQAQYLRTQAFCNKVKELDILEPMQAQVELASGERLALGGFMAVSRTKLKALPAEKLSELAQTDELELLYVHLQSMRNFLALRDRLAVIEGGKRTAQSPTAEAAREAADGDSAAAPSGKRRSGRAAAE